MKIFNFFKRKKSLNKNQTASNQKLNLLFNSDLVAETNIGLDRERNEDYAVAGMNNFNDKIICICDGLGGYLGGQNASELLGQTIIKNFFNTDFKNKEIDAVKTWFVAAINEAKFEITKFIHKNPLCDKMATTLVGAIISGDEIYGFNVGDSRLYGLKNGQVTQISKDHNFLNFLLDQNASSETINSYGNQIYAIVNYIGQFDETEIKYDFFHLKVSDYDAIFATSDGVHNFLTNDLFAKSFVSGQKLKETAVELIDKALSNMSNDNLSIAIAKLN